MITWTAPSLLTAYRTALRLPGVYIIGGQRDKTLPITSRACEDAYLGRDWPDNFVPYYVGISESSSVGVRARLSKHKRSRGSTRIRDRVADGQQLYFIAAYGTDWIEYEALYLCLKTDQQFCDNIRCEMDRSSKRQYEKVRAKMTQHERDHYDRLEISESGM